MEINPWTWQRRKTYYWMYTFINKAELNNLTKRKLKKIPVETESYDNRYKISYMSARQGETLNFCRQHALNFNGSAATFEWPLEWFCGKAPASSYIYQKEWESV